MVFFEFKYSELGGKSDNDDWWNQDQWYTPDQPSNDQEYEQEEQPYEPTPSPSPSPSGSQNQIASYPQDAIEVNWVLKGATTHIKHQVLCGSCWAFAVVGVIEAYYLMKGLGTYDLSQQQLVDCEPVSNGCKGGQPNKAMQYAINNGLVVEAKYPYRQRDQNCAHNSGPHKIPKIAQYTGREAIQAALRRGPVTAVVHTPAQRGVGFQRYTKGIFDRCSNEQPNHAIVLVGFTKDYWIIRNSWGTEWGEQGHMRLKRNQNNGNACGVETLAFGIVDQ